MQAKRMMIVCGMAVSVLVSTAAVHAEVYSQIARGLYLAGFRPSVTSNPLTKGIDFSYTRSFSDFTTAPTPGNTLQYGGASLTLNGGLTVHGSVAKRPFPGASFGITSSGNPDIPAGDLSYILTIPRAVEQITVVGKIKVDTMTTVDATGFYSTVMNVENRGTVTGTGLTGISENIDFNVGPISQVGNVYLTGVGGLVNLFGGPGDAIAGLPDTGPLFSLDSGQLDSLDLDDPEQLEAYVNSVVLQAVTDAATDPTAGKVVATNAIPEPSTLALLSLSGLALVRGRRRAA